MSAVCGGRLSARLGVAASANEARRLHLTIECYWQSARGLSVLLEPSRMESGKGKGGGGRKEANVVVGANLLSKWVSYVQGGDSFYLSTVCWEGGQLRQPVPPPYPFFPKHTLSLMCLRCLFFVFFNLPIKTVTGKGLKIILSHLNDLGH